ncbi:MAG TPA: TolC family protein [Bryobacteraceae bacterium]|nr:TolC family protein [Bryobacteraceae bacterium]
MKKAVSTILCCLLTPTAWPQQLQIAPVRPHAPVILRSYLPAEVPPVRLSNSSRLTALIRAGKLYLTAQDAIALALENSIDLEISRYNPLIATWNIERAQAGGALPGVPSAASQAGSVASGQGVAGSQAAAGVSVAGAGSSSKASGNATISQIGPVTQVLDPVIQETSAFSHTSNPQPDEIQSEVANLINNTKSYSGSYQQGLISGGLVTASYADHYLNENAPLDLLNPSVAPAAALSIQHNLLRGFGVAVNARSITVARINLKNTDLQFKGQVINVASQVLNTYYALGADLDNIKAKQVALQTSQQLLDNVKEQIRIGSLAPLEEANAEAQLAISRRDVVDTETALAQDELQLKTYLSRQGPRDPALSAVQIVPLDRITIPATDDLPPIKDLVRRAIANRTDLALEQANIESSEISALGTKNGVLPTLLVFAAESTAGLAGTPHVVEGQTANSYFQGGIGTALGQVFRRDFPTNRAGVVVAGPARNRAAQADAAIDSLQLRQSQLTQRKDLNQVEVDVQNGVIALRQARARFDAAVKNRVLQEQLLDAEQRRFRLGASIPYNVIQQQRDLVGAQYAESAALVSYSNAKIALDQSLGATLEVNHISIDEARAGRITAAPAPLPPEAAR